MLKEEKDYIRELKTGSFSAFDHIFSLYKERLYAFAIGYLKVTEDAKELVQEVFVKVWENRNRLDETRSFNAYLFTIAKNLILNFFRKKANQQSFIEYIKQNTGLTYSNADEELEYEDLLKTANSYIELLPGRRKEIYRLSREKGLSNEEIAQALKISKKTVENQLTLALKFLQEKLGEENLLGMLFIALFL